MFGRQSSILVTNDDLRDLESMLRRRGDVVLLSDKPNEGRNALLPLKALPLDRPGKESLFCYLAPPDDPANIVVRPLSDTKTTVDLENSELIEFQRTYCLDGVIRRGRFYYTVRYHEGDDVLEKRKAFVSWSNKIAAAIRRALTFDKSLHASVGPDAARKIASGELKVIV
jgi:hypothetical protein